MNKLKRNTTYNFFIHSFLILLYFKLKKCIMEKIKTDNFKLFTHGEDGFGNKFTLATILITETTDVISVGIGLALCHENDNFCRKTGRNIASSRAANRPLSVIDLNKTDSSKDQFENMKTEFFTAKKMVAENGTETFMVRNQ